MVLAKTKKMILGAIIPVQAYWGLGELKLEADGTLNWLVGEHDTHVTTVTLHERTW